MCWLGVTDVLRLTEERAQIADFKAHSVQATATVVDHADFAGKSWSLQVSYEAEGSTRSPLIPVSHADYDRYANGATVPVVYLIESPAKARLADTAFINSPPYYMPLGIALIVVGLGIAIGSLIWGRRISTSNTPDLDSVT